MPPGPEQTSPSPTDAEHTAILDAVQGAPTPGGYGDRFAEDAFDYPSSSAHSWSAGPAPTGAEEAGAEPQGPAAVPPGPTARAVRRSDGWRQAAVRHRSVLTATAALVVVGGFTLALSTVDDTVTSPPGPGGTVQVPVPKSPTVQPFSPPAPATTEPPGDAASPAATPTQKGVPAGTGEQRDRGEGKGREDGDDADG
ncbi:hypothetical protein [Streptomyces gilvus]|uniref:hypothetical protein n=1 Tax=Streptomyces gilvus TaxID=2920937 RepID=UPI001F0F0384|nr:hypothetical protein [Streptomyces sp. CME 23]MCH5677809.1 hypothetical protein [Streptomyces sp. CME 23]